MIHASLFSGIGGFDLAAQWAGWTNAFNCEIDPFCQKVLKYHFSNATQYTDIRTTDFSIWHDRIDVLTGGFPCQPFSVAGKRKGMEDERYLWPEMLRAIHEISPRWIVGENVRGIVNCSGGLVFLQVCADLEAEGYEVQPVILPACGVEAPHRRDRVWFVAHRTDAGIEAMQGRQDCVCEFGITSYANEERSDRGCSNSNLKAKNSTKRTSVFGKIGGFSEIGTTSNTQNPRQSPRTERQKQEQSWGAGERMGIPTNWSTFPTQPPVCSRNDGLSDRLDGITFPKWRTDSIKAYGNAIVPQVVLKIFNAINQYK